MGLREQWTQLTQFLRTARTKGRRLIEEEQQGLSSTEQVSQREDRRLGGMSAEDRAWEQASLQRDRDRSAQPRQVTEDETR